MYFVQYDAPVSLMTLYPIGKKGWIQGHILGETTDLKFDNHKNVKNVFSAHLNKLDQIYVRAT